MDKARILVVEDEGIIRLDIKNTLVKLGYAIAAEAATGEDAISKAQDTHPDLVLMDIRLKGEMDGVTAADQIHRRFAIPIIYLTANADESTLQRAKITEPFGYLLKPFEARELHTAIEVGLYKHKVEAALRDKERWLSTVLTSIGDGVITTDTEGCITFMNPLSEALTGWRSADGCGKPLAEVYHVVNTHTHNAVADPVAKALGERMLFDLASDRTLITKGGLEIPIDDSAMPIRDADGHATGVVLSFRDISRRKEIENALYEGRERLQVTLSSIGDAVITTNVDAFVEYLNPAAECLTGWSTKEARGRTVQEVFRIVHEGTYQSVENPVTRCLREGHVVYLGPDSILLRQDGQEFVVQDSVAPIRNREGSVIGAVLICHDVTELHRMTRRMAHLASHDSLTGLLNRFEFENHLKRTLAEIRGNGHQGALLYVDLDHFKIVNDTCGHPVGDDLLKRVAGILQGQMRPADTLARLGGDEFGVVLNGCSTDEAEAISQALCRAIQDHSFLWRERCLQVSSSIGLVPIGPGDDDPEELLRMADCACYVAKEKGRNRVHCYRPNDTDMAVRHAEMQWVQRIQQALSENRLRLYCQTARYLPNGGGMPHYREILLRLVDAAGEVVPAIRFIPIAERYGLMPAIDRWVIGTAFATVCRQEDQDVTYGINLSGQCLGDDDLLDFILAQMALNNIRPERICFEITESAAVANYTHAASFVAALRKKGCRFALDDFGSGLSSFGYLKNLHVDYLKIDGNFVRGMVNDSFDFTLVQAINEIGHSLGLQTIAEFVETEHIIKVLGELGVDYAQGYAIGRPEPSSACMPSAIVEVVSTIASGQ